MNTKIFLGYLFILVFIPILKSFDINATSYYQYMGKEAEAMVGIPTSNFPHEAFINYILYGHTDVPFTYNDFLLSFGDTTTDLDTGYLVIGNDGLLGGIAIDDSSVAIPVPYSTIQNIPVGILYRYFPNGYSIFPTNQTLSYWYAGDENSSFENVTKCKDCLVGMQTTNFDPNFLIEGNFLAKRLFGNWDYLSVNLFGYLQEYNKDAQTAIVKINFYDTDFNGRYLFYAVDEADDTKMNMSIDENQNITFSGGFKVNIGFETGIFYNFSGWWKYVPQPKKVIH